MKQATSHPFAAETFYRHLFDKDEVSAVVNKLLDVPAVSLTTQIRTSQKYDQGLSKYAWGLDYLAGLGDPTLKGDFDLAPFLAMAKNERTVAQASCPSCKKSPPELPMKARDCPHIYCKDCLVDIVIGDNKAHDNQDLKLSLCLAGCGETLALGTELQTLKCVIQKEQKDQTMKSVGRDSHSCQLTRPPLSNGFFTAAHCVDGLSLPSSSKLTAAMAVILTWMNEAPDDKIIVFMQFITPAKVMGRMLEKAGIDFLYYFGNTTTHYKTKALKAWEEDPTKQVLLAGLRCGGQALNLTSANRVIIIDPWWNKSVDDQAFARVHRMGQTKKTYLVRLWAEDTVDEKVYELQAGKKQVVDYTLQDDNHVPEPLTWDEKEALLSGSICTAVGRGKKTGNKPGANKSAEALAARREAARAKRLEKMKK